MKKYILVHFEIQKKLIVVGLFLLLAEFCLSQASFGRRILKATVQYINLQKCTLRPIRSMP